MLIRSFNEFFFAALYLKKCTADFKVFFSIRLIRHRGNASGNRDPDLTYTSGSTGSGIISEELHNRFNFFL